MAAGANPLPLDAAQIFTAASGDNATLSAGPLLDQSKIEPLLAGTADAKPSTPTAASTIPAASSPGSATDTSLGGKLQPMSGLASADIDYLLSQAEQALAALNNPVGPAAGEAVQPYKLTDFAAAVPSTEAAALDLIRDVELDVEIELGRSQMYLEDTLKLHKGSVVPLDKLADDSVDVYVNGRLIARGEVLVLNDSFCVRVAELIASGQMA